MLALLDSPDTYLLRYHRYHAGIMSWAFGRGATVAGDMSYDQLAKMIGSNDDGLVVELACGDGLLIERILARGIPAGRVVGVDMSPDEMRLAHRRLKSQDGLRLECECAQDLSLPDDCASHVLCHNSLHVMSDIAAVIAQAARVLRSGGHFAAIIPAARPATGAYAAFYTLFAEFYGNQATRAPVFGDERVRSRDGLSQLFGSGSGFGGLEIDDFELILDGPVDDVWNSVSTHYEAYMMLPRDRAQLRQRWLDAIAPIVRDDGTVPCSMWMNQLVCRKAV